MRPAEVAVVPFGLRIGDLVNMRPLADIIRSHYEGRTVAVMAPKELAWLLPSGTRPLTDARGMGLWKRPSHDAPLSRLAGRLKVGQLSPLVHVLPISTLTRGLKADLRARGHREVINLLREFAGLDLDSLLTPGASTHGPRHVIDLLAASLASKGMDVDSTRLEPRLTLPRRRPIDSPAIMLNPTAGSTLKEAPMELWAIVARRLLRAGMRPIVVAAPGRSAAQHLVRRVPGCVLLSSADLRAVASWIAGSDLLVSPDTGLLHIAAAAGVPYVGLFGSTDPAFTGPYRRRNGIILETPSLHQNVCRSCWTAQMLPIGRCPLYGPDTCLSGIEPDAVLDAIRQLLPR